MRPLLVGEANPYGGDPGYALWPEPRGSSGWRLCHTILEMDQHDYLRAFDRVNLCHRDWSVREARETARSLFEKYDGPFILFGAKVTGTFGLTFGPFTVKQAVQGPFDILTDTDAVTIPATSPVRLALILPHPSGLSRAWNDPQSAVRARELVKEVRQQCGH